MTLATLALTVAAGLLGPVLAGPKSWRLPVVLGELLAGIALGATGLKALDASDSTFSFLSDLGFALVMFVAGSHVPIRDPRLRRGASRGLIRAAVIGALAVPAGWGVAALFHTGHIGLYAVLIASSSAALVLPIVESLGLSGPKFLQMLPQVAVADAACIVALPLAIDVRHAGRAALGAAAVLACAAVLFLVLRIADRRGLWDRTRALSKRRSFALELRVNLTLLFALAALATATHVSIMLAGFSFGAVVAAVGEPRRLAKQLFAVTEGFFAPLFFVWLGASLNLRELGAHPSFLLLGLVLGGAAVIVHLSAALLGQTLSLAALAAAQLGVPIAAATLGGQLGLLQPGEAPALILGALVTIAVAIAAGAVAARALPPPVDAADPVAGTGITVASGSLESKAGPPDPQSSRVAF